MKTRGPRSPIDDYLAQLTNPAAKRTLTALRAQLKRLLPRATETLSYGMPAFRLENGKVVAGFAFFGRNCGLYPHSGNIVPKLGKLAEGLKTSKAGVTFPPDRPLPAALVRALVKARVEEAERAAVPKRAAAKRARRA